jgi:hypothetical protein
MLSSPLRDYKKLKFRATVQAQSRNPHDAPDARCADEVQSPYEAKTWRGDYFRERLLFKRRNFSRAVDQRDAANQGTKSAQQ